MTPAIQKSTPRKPRRQSALSLSRSQADRVCRAVRALWIRLGSQVCVARQLGVSQQTISGVLARRNASPAFAAVLARNLGVPYEELLGPGESKDPLPPIDLDPILAHIDLAAPLPQPHPRLKVNKA